MRLFRFQPSRGGHLLPHVRHREADPQVPGRPHGQHARVAEREEDRGHPGSVSTITRETLYRTVKFAFYSRRCEERLYVYKRFLTPLYADFAQ